MEKDVWPPPPTETPKINDTIPTRLWSAKLVDLLVFSFGLASLGLFVCNLVLHLNPKLNGLQPTFACIAYALGVYALRKRRQSQIGYIGFWLGQVMCLVWGFMTVLDMGHR